MLRLTGRILSIDVGLRNFAYCLYDADGRSVLQLANVDMFGARATRQAEARKEVRRAKLPAGHGVVRSEIHHIIGALAAWQRDVMPVTSDLRCVLVENQFKGEMRVIQTVLAMLYDPPPRPSPGRVVFIQPAAVKKHFALTSARTYAERKSESVAKAIAMLRAMPGHERWVDVLQAAAKPDDLAECFLQCMFWVDSAQRPVQAAPVERTAARKRGRRTSAAGAEGLQARGGPTGGAR